MPETPWYQPLPSILRRHAALKAIGTTLFISVFMVAYLQLLKAPLFPATEMPLTWFDRSLAFQPNALPIYLTLWLYVSLPPALLQERAELQLYGLAMTTVCLIGLACFLFWPTAVPATVIDWDSYPGFVFLRAIDATGNACPSLHVATAAFSALWIDRRLHELAAGAGVRWGNWLWCLAIAYSTLAIKQHVLVDVLAGFALGLAGAASSLHWRSLVLARRRQDVLT